MLKLKLRRNEIVINLRKVEDCAFINVFEGIFIPLVLQK